MAGRDTEEKSRAAATLRPAVFDHPLLGMFLLTDAGAEGFRLAEVNARFAAMAGLPPADMVGLTLFDLMSVQ